MIKYCGGCSQFKYSKSFFKNKAKKDGLSTWCKSCHTKNCLENQKKNPPWLKPYRIKRRLQRREYVRSLKNKPCTDCNKRFNPWQMEFDHLPKYNKKFNISTVISGNTPLSEIYKETLKCDVVCANCHRNRTHERNSSHEPKEM